MIHPDSRGLACPVGGFHIDPWAPVPVAVLTHAHADHARHGSSVYHASEASLGLLRKRLGPQAVLHGHPYGAPFVLGDTLVSLHPAGHVLGSAQVRVAGPDGVWVVSGDYKRAPDPTCAPFEVVPCDVFITEATFGLPIYRWPTMEHVLDEILEWWQANARAGRASLLLVYALGKAQRLLAGLAGRVDAPVLVHGAVFGLLEPYHAAGIALAETATVGEVGRRADFAGRLIMAPPSAAATPWTKRFGDVALGFCSGWMQIRGNRRRRGYERGFVVSDHADWGALLATIEQTGAERVYVTHGYHDTLARYLADHGWQAAPLETLYGDDAEA